MGRIIAAAMALAGLMILGGCGDSEPQTDVKPSTSLALATRTPTPSNDPASVAGSSEGLALDELRQHVLDAVRGESSVHMAIGNLNPPPATETDQDYSTPEGDLEMVVSVEPGRPTIVGRRVDGEVYLSVDGKHFEHVPSQKLVQAESGAFVGLLRTDVLRDFTSIFAATAKADFIGDDPSVGAGVARYRLLINTEACSTECGGATLGVPRFVGLPKVIPAQLWVGSTGLPVRIEVRLSAPLGGIEGTGTARVDYSRWGEPIDVERP